MNPKIREIKEVASLKGKFHFYADNEYIDKLIAQGRALPMTEVELDLPELRTSGAFIHYDRLLGHIAKSLPLEHRHDTLRQAILYHSQQRNALLALHRSTYGEGWLHKWDTSLPIHRWHGVKTEVVHLVVLSASSKRYIIPLSSVVELDLSYNRLSRRVGDTSTSFIAPQLGKLTALRKLYLNNNDLQGTIPPTIGQLTQLTDLRLHKNQLSGSIPSSIGKLTKLTRLQLDHNRLSGHIPRELGLLKELRHLTLHHNNLSSQCLKGPRGQHTIHNIPETLADIPHLMELRVYGNQLYGAYPDALRQHPFFASWHLEPQQSFFGFDKDLCTLLHSTTPTNTMKTLCISGAGLLPSSEHIHVRLPGRAGPGTCISAPHTVDDWVERELPLHRGDIITEVRITYRVQGQETYISQVRLVVYRDEHSAVVMHDDATDHRSAQTATAVSKCHVKVDTSVLLSLRMYIGDARGSIEIGAIEIDYIPAS